MPTYQTQMATALGLGPGLNVAGQIPSVAFTVQVLTKTAAYTVPVTESGTFYNNLGAAGSVTFTLPAVATAAGCWYLFHAAVAQNLVVTAPANTLVTDGNAGQTSVTFSTASHIIGGAVIVYCDGAKWYAFCAGNLLAVPTFS